jgi:hypothetical protein
MILHTESHNSESVKYTIRTGEDQIQSFTFARKVHTEVVEREGELVGRIILIDTDEGWIKFLEQNKRSEEIQ